MSNFIVSARKYRPTRFEDVVGQQHVSQTLKNALQTDHLAHAFLFCGPRGVGKTTCARILAKVLNCQNVSDDFEPCNTCSSCQSFNENASFNITELDAASNNSVEHIRALIEQVRFQPQQGKYKVFIIDEVHMLSNQAFNAFLKTLEEPPPYAIFILATTEKHKIIPTILSRCQIFDFKRIQIPDMIDHLQSICDSEGIKAEPDALHIIAQKADGALRDALSIFDRMVSFSGDKITYQGVIDNLNVLDYDYYFRFVDAMLSEQLPLVLEIFNEVLNKGFEGDLFINGLGEHLRNLLVARDSRTLPLLEVGDALRDRYQQQGAMAPPSFILTALNLANECDVHYKTARNKRLHVEMALIKMTYILRAVDAGQMVQRAEPSVEKKTVVGSSHQSSVGSDQSSVVSRQSSVISGQSTVVSDQGAVGSDQSSGGSDQSSVFSEQSAVGSEEGKSKRASGGDKPKMSFNLDALEEEVVEEEGLEEPEEEGELTLEELDAAWKKYAEQTGSDSIKSVLLATELSVDEERFVATVSSTFAENTLLQELGLMEFLRKELRRPKLMREIRVDTDKLQQEAPPPKKTFLTPKEKYLEMREEYPLLTEFRKVFDLKPDND
jgi:DNA polymerase-3 subunit gamma/tau